MDTRKIQQVGSGTYTVSLPKEWATREGIEAGTVVTVHSHVGGVLAIEARERDEQAAVRVDVTDQEPAALARTVRAAYAAGVPAVVFDAAAGFGTDQRRAVERAADSLAGLTIAEASPTRLRVRTLLDAEEVSIAQSVRQLGFVALSMHRDATAALTGDGAAPADRDDQVDRLFAMVDRHVVRGLDRLETADALGLTRPELFALRAAADHLVSVADEAQRLADLAGAVEAPVDESAGDAALGAVAAPAREAVEDGLATVVGDGDRADAQAALAACEDCRERIRAARGTAVDAGRHDLARALDALDRTVDAADAVARLGLRSCLRDAETVPEDGESAAADAASR